MSDDGNPSEGAALGRFVLPEVLPDLEVDVLNDLFGLRVIDETAPDDGVDAGCGEVVELREGDVVAGSGPREQLDEMRTRLDDGVL